MWSQGILTDDRGIVISRPGMTKAEFVRSVDPLPIKRRMFENRVVTLSTRPIQIGDFWWTEQCQFLDQILGLSLELCEEKHPDMYLEPHLRDGPILDFYENFTRQQLNGRVIATFPWGCVGASYSRIDFSSSISFRYD